MEPEVKYTHERLQLLQFPLILLIIYIHNSDQGANIAGGRVDAKANAALTYIIELISNGLGRVAVPLFFAISGYRLFLNVTWTRDEARRKGLSRVRSLLVPYVFWNVLTFGALYLAQNIPQTARFFSKEPLAVDAGILNTLFGFTHHPVAYQFWFIRDLMALVVLAPVVYMACRRVGRLWLGALAILWATEYWPVMWPSAEATLFFSIGSYLAINNVHIFRLDRWVVTATVATLAAFALKPMLDPQGAAERTLMCLGIVAALVAAVGWTGYAFANSTARHLLTTMAATSFFIFAMHEPTITVLRKLLYAIAPSGQIGPFLIYLLLPWAVALIGATTWFALRLTAPAFLRLITGGR